MADPISPLKTALAGRYAVGRELGRGGMATVFLARDLKHDRDVALKVLRPDVAENIGAERFLLEIRLAAMLSHPNILPLFDSGDAGGYLYFVMPIVEGRSLRDRLNAEPTMPVAESVRLAQEVAGALDYAHRHGVVHRDVKPENVLLHDGHALVADFGIGKALASPSGKTLTESGVALGTPAYMSPEQAAGEPVDGRSDLFSLGCVLYEMLAGEPPFTGPTVQAVIAKRFFTTPADLVALRDQVPRAVARAVQRAMARAPVDRFETAAAFATALGEAEPAPPRPEAPAKSVAVLPFVNRSADAENEFFADGITEDVIAQLSRIRALKVISSTSVKTLRDHRLSPREIGTRLGVATLLEGSVRRAGDRVRIVAQLLDVETNEHRWVETYDRQLTDIFAIQTDVALRIAKALEATLSDDERARLAKEPTRDLQAYQLYLKGRHCVFRFTQEGLRTGIEYFEQAIALDPGYALAYTGIAHAYLEMIVQGTDALNPAEGYRRARDAVGKAISLDGGLAEAHCMLAYELFAGEFDWTGAEREFKTALELNPGMADSHDLYGQMLSAVGRFDEAMVVLKRAHELDPLAHRSDMASTLLRAGRNDEALQVALPIVEFDPHYPRAHATLGWAYLLNGKLDQGIASLRHAAALSPGETLWFAQLGQALAFAGRPDEARDVLRQLEQLAQTRYVSPYHFAYVLTGLGQADDAIDWLERAYAERAGSVYGIRSSFLFASLRSHPRFKALLGKMNLA